MVSTRIVPSKPALIIEDERKYLVVTDLHIGFESQLVANNMNVDRNTIAVEVASEISQIVRDEDIESLILLGDIKSGIRSISSIEWNDIPVFFDIIGGQIDIMLVPGNHDSGIEKLVPDNVTMTGPSGMILGDTLLTHGHAMPSENFSHVENIIMGHVHPVFFDEDSVLNGQRVWISARVQKRDLFPSAKNTIELLVMPSFNRYFYAAHMQKYRRSISPIIQRIRSLESAKIITLDGSIIGNEDDLRRVI